LRRSVAAVSLVQPSSIPSRLGRRTPTSNTSSHGVALITGASAGIGTVYADRLPKRDYDVLVAARNKERLTAVADNLRRETGRQITI